MHTIAPSAFIHESLLNNPSICPDCRKEFVTKDGVVYNVPYVDLQTKEQKWGLMCFCSTTCILQWYPRQEMGRS